MDSKRATRLSRFLSYVLRHHPEEIGVPLDEAGWVGVGVLLGALEGGPHAMTVDELREIVATCDKQRYAFSEDGSRIRANQGHSVRIDLGYAPKDPPPRLYHGTVSGNLASIRAKGLLRGERHHVHLSESVDVAKSVGGRRGKPIILTICSGSMAAQGHAFFVSENAVWLTERVPPEFIVFPEE